MNLCLLLASLWANFANPSQAAKPWTYYFWQNTLTDRETITEEVADIARLGFGGVLLTDSRGYWVDDNHLLVPPNDIRWASEAWLDLVEHTVRACARNNLKFEINIAASGGHLRGEEDAKGDNPKCLVYRLYRPGEPFEKPASPYFREIASYRLKTEGAVAFDGAWHVGGDGIYTSEVTERMCAGGVNGKPRLKAEICDTGSVIVRFGSDIIPNGTNDIDVLDRTAVRRHLERSIGRLIARVPELVGAQKTFAGLYNVSWEGSMPTWSATFAEDFRRYAGYDLLPYLPILAGFELATRPTEALMADFRASRAKMMCEHLYREVQLYAHEHGMLASSESGGPWQRYPETFGEADQLAFLAANDLPQGEFWPLRGYGAPEGGHACVNGRFITRGPISAAHIYDQPIVCAEAFTHMHLHWSVDPAFLKPVGDIAFANGINRLVWHTYSTSPRKYGVPGYEYFAGSHINRHVTWNRDLTGFITYLARCQSLLQAGSPVTDLAVLVGPKPYVHWETTANGFFRNRVSDEIPVKLPKGYQFDLVNDDAQAKNPNLLARYAAVIDLRAEKNRASALEALNARLAALPPDVETASNWLWCHRRTDEADFYFVAGEGAAEMTFRATAPVVEVWDAVTGTRHAAEVTRCAAGRTTLALELPRGGSCFVVFRKDGKEGAAPTAAKPFATRALTGAWQLSFAYVTGVTARPPEPISLQTLVDFTTREDLRYFGGTATYRTTFTLSAADCAARVALSLGALETGLARVRVNGTDCGVVWCAPWSCDISKAVKAGENELVIEYTNNWHNRFIGDCHLPEDARVTRSNVRTRTVERTGDPANSWSRKPTIYSGYCPNDPLQPSGLTGPVELEFAK